MFECKLRLLDVVNFFFFYVQKFDFLPSQILFYFIFSVPTEHYMNGIGPVLSRLRTNCTICLIRRNTWAFEGENMHCTEATRWFLTVLKKKASLSFGRYSKYNTWSLIQSTHCTCSNACQSGQVCACSDWPKTPGIGSYSLFRLMTTPVVCQQRFSPMSW